MFPIETEKFSREKAVKNCAYFPQAFVIMAWLNQTSTELGTIFLDGSSNSS